MRDTSSEYTDHFVKQGCHANPEFSCVDPIKFSDTHLPGSGD